MYKSRKIKFHDHPILRNLELDFCDSEGNPVDTIIIAGENGTGKSTILNELYKIASHAANRKMTVEITDGSRTVSLTYYLKYFANRNPAHTLYVQDGLGMNTYYSSDELKHRYPFAGLFSDVDINFRAQDISTVTSLTLDSVKDSRRSSSNLPTTIKQLLIDVQALDDRDVAQAARNNPDKGLDYLTVKERMPRFTRAFNKMFSDLTYSHVENASGHKAIVFEKAGVKVPIDSLSSGEKQVVYRGCFLLKDVNATNGAFVFIDEPEISLHPTWQMKIMDYYKGIFTGEDGKQTSQIFAVTHSPFVIHNENRRSDKVIVLTRNENGDIVVKDKPEYFKCNSVEAVQDAFAIQGFSADKPTVYLEGRTDEMYFNKALEVYEIGVPFQFKWIGYIDAKGEEANTGKDSLNKAVPFLISRKLSVKSVCLYDCDTNKPKKEVNNVITMSIPRFANDKGISVGVENALVFGDIDVAPYRQQRIEVDGYGIEKRIPDFQKMECCKHICSLDKERLKVVFANLKTVIESLVQLYAEE